MNLIWYFLAKLLALPAVSDWLIQRAMKTPYNHIYKQAGDKSTYEVPPDCYMKRYWLFNPYSRGFNGQEASKYWWFPWNIRIHNILREDQDSNLHDHPWNARTVILKGWYYEKRLDSEIQCADYHRDVHAYYYRREGDTARINFGEYHSIEEVPADGGVWTLFITGKYQGTWGFRVNGLKVQWKKYLGLN